MEFLTREQIDFKKWNARIKNSSIENVFCYSWYLDAVANNWGALIQGDYQTIAPVPYSKKLGIKQMYQPAFTRELDIFGDGFGWDEILAFLSTEFKAVQFRNNSESITDQSAERKHQWLKLDADQLKYSTNAKRLIKKANEKFQYTSAENAADVMNLFMENTFDKIDSISKEDAERLGKLMEVALGEKHGEVIVAMDGEQVAGAGFFLKDKSRITYLKGAATEEGKSAGVMYGIINHAISNYLDDFNTFDFGGSEIEGVANFYKKFGASDRSYYNYTIDNLPTWYKTLKRIKG